MEHRIVAGSDLLNPDCAFAAKDIYSLSMITGVDIVGTELTIDQLVSKVYYPYGEYAVQVIAPSDYDRVVSSDGYVIATNRVYVNPRVLPYGTVVRYYRDDVLASKMYVKSVDRLAKYIYKINTISAVGLMETQKHYGGIYSGESFESVVGEIIDGAVDFTVADDVKNLQVYGWLPYDTKRANLHQLLFTNGVMCDKDANGDLLFRFISNDTSISIPKNRIYYGGNVDYPAFASAVDVTEHSFFALPTDVVVTVYDNTDGSETANHTFIAFRDAPLHDLSVTGTLVIESSGVNWAVVTGTGILTGKKYTHSTRILRRVADNAGEQRENVATVADAYLVNVTNSDNVARRVLSYYNARKIVTASIVEQGEKCGDLITAYDPYDEAISGFISRMQSNVSGIVKAECEIITDYVPTGQGSNYTQAVILTGSGTWAVPDAVFAKENPVIQVTMISGGHGGSRGEDGEQGTDTWSSVGPATKGGAGGEPGPGGRVITATIDCTGKTSFAFQCGVGGASEQAGTDTSFGEYSSAGGAPSPFGVANIFTGEVYGIPGQEKGVDGGSGSSASEEGTPVTYQGSTWYPGANRGEGESDGGYYGNGGYPGGAAVGSDGHDGGDGYINAQPGGGYFASGGAGGKGANAAAGSSQTILGAGGNGGHGGGGGGQGGSARGSSSMEQMQGGSGVPGTGGAGGKGGPGMVLIYF